MLGKIRRALHLNNTPEELPPQNKIKPEGKGTVADKHKESVVDGKVPEGNLATASSELKVKPITDTDVDPELVAKVVVFFEAVAEYQSAKEDYEKTIAETRAHKEKIEDSVRKIEVLRKEQDQAIKEHEAAMESFKAAEDARIARLEANTQKLEAIRALRAKRAAGEV